MSSKYEELEEDEVVEDERTFEMTSMIDLDVDEEGSVIELDIDEDSDSNGLDDDNDVIIERKPIENRVVRFLWGDISAEELLKYLFLGILFAFLIGVYWLLRPMKDKIFSNLVDSGKIPLAKLLSVACIIPMVLLYSKLANLFQKHHLFIGICLYYIAGLTVLTMLLQIAGFTFAPLPCPSNDPEGCKMKVRPGWHFVGWLNTVYVESFGSIMVAMFWSFVASQSNSSESKKGYAVIVTCGQVGSVLGSFFPSQAETFGVLTLYAMAVFGVVLVMVAFILFLRHSPTTNRESRENLRTKSATGFLEGLILIVTKPYVAGILGVATMYEVVGSILDFQMKITAIAALGDGKEFLKFMGWYGMLTNGSVLLLGLLGTSALLRRFDIRVILLLFPIAVVINLALVVIVSLGGNSPESGPASVEESVSQATTGLEELSSDGGGSWPARLYVLVVSMICLKALSYALNNPAKEILYIPTSLDIKYKAKGWIDMFGGRQAKAVGSLVNATVSFFTADLLATGVVIFWCAVAVFVGKTNKLLVESHAVIE